MITMRRTSAPPAKPGPLPSRNAAAGGTVDKSDFLEGSLDGMPQFVVDEVDTTHFGGTRQLWGTDYVQVHLNGSGTLNHIKIVHPSACPLGQYDVLLSASEGSPVIPDNNSTDWKLVQTITGGKTCSGPSCMDEFDLSPTDANYLALIFHSSTCTNWAYQPKYQVSEIYAMTVAGVAAPAEHQPTCASQ
jgi:hypothetical protein